MHCKVPALNQLTDQNLTILQVSVRWFRLSVVADMLYDQNSLPFAPFFRHATFNEHFTIVIYVVGKVRSQVELYLRKVCNKIR